MACNTVELTSLIHLKGLETQTHTHTHNSSDTMLWGHAHFGLISPGFELSSEVPAFKPIQQKWIRFNLWRFYSIEGRVFFHSKNWISRVMETLKIEQRCCRLINSKYLISSGLSTKYQYSLLISRVCMLKTNNKTNKMHNYFKSASRRSKSRCQ